jgi:4-hydroxy-tetrahydrodipicolinate reductase
MAAPRVTVVGASGRMGRRVCELLATDGRLELHAALVRSGQLDLGPGVRVTNVARDAITGAQVVIDFSAPAAAQQLAPECAAHGASYLLASTGLTDVDERAVQAAAQRVAVLQAANLSIGVNVLLGLVEQAARQLAGFEVEIAELHHRHKKDAPSGTALALGKAVERGRGPLQAVGGRHGVGEARQPDELGYAALRGGDVAGEHTVYFFGEGERLELSHRATTPMIFARGALDAAVWLVGRAPGRYTMADVLS